MRIGRQRNRRFAALCLAVGAVAVLALITVAGGLWGERALATDFSMKNLPPSFRYSFGTDWMGRDLFVRTVAGLSLSIRIGVLTAAASAAIAFVLGLTASLGKGADTVVSCLTDLVMGIPHMLLLILVSFAVGKGFWGVVAGISLTHWASLARLLRAEALQLKESQYVKVARKLGKSPVYVAVKHMTPHLIPQLLVGAVLLFPHAVLHEASITFLGFGLSPEQPAIGIILSEGMKYLVMGKWWLALFPGALLALAVILFQAIASAASSMVDPGQAHS